jgi:hypothetical protein
MLWSWPNTELWSWSHFELTQLSAYVGNFEPWLNQTLIPDCGSALNSYPGNILSLDLSHTRITYLGNMFSPAPGHILNFDHSHWLDPDSGYTMSYKSVYGLIGAIKYMLSHDLAHKPGCWSLSPLSLDSFHIPSPYSVHFICVLIFITYCALTVVSLNPGNMLNLDPGYKLSLNLSLPALWCLSHSETLPW